MYNLSCKAKSNLERTSHLYFAQIEKAGVLSKRTNDYPNQHSVFSSFPSLKKALESNQWLHNRGRRSLPEWVTDRWGSNRIGTAEHGMVSAETHGMLLSPVQHHWLTETAATPLEEVDQVPHHSKTIREETRLHTNHHHISECYQL